MDYMMRVMLAQAAGGGGGGSAYDDPFTGGAGPVDAKWSRWSSNGLNLPTVALDGAGNATVDPVITGGWDPGGIDQPMPAGDWEFEAPFTMVHRDWENGVGMVIRESATNKWMWVGAYYNLSAGQHQVAAESSVGGYLYNSNVSLASGSYVGICRVARVGSTYYLRCNYNGAGWVTVWSGTVASYFTTAPGRIGLYVRPTVPNGTPAVGVFGYFTKIA